MLLVLPLPAAAQPQNHRVIRVVNQYRQAHGLAPLRPSYSLWRSSRSYAKRMMLGDYFGHASRIAMSPRFSLRGENLALWDGWRLRYRHVVRGWMRSPGHRAILLEPRYRYIGVGRCRGRMGRRLATTWVLHAGRS
jgi:uncharacterized protein YkwD